MGSITFHFKRKTTSDDVNDKVRWLGESLGLFNQRDKDSSCYRIFVELIKSSKINKPVSSDELAYKANLSRGTVIHHIHKLIDSGLIISSKNRYLLRQKQLSLILADVKKDMDRMFEELVDVAKKIDEGLNLK